MEGSYVNAAGGTLVKKKGFYPIIDNSLVIVYDFPAKNQFNFYKLTAVAYSLIADLMGYKSRKDIPRYP
jgi:hypothetical protein